MQAYSKDGMLVAVIACVAVFVLSCSGAIAARGHEFVGTFGEPCIAEPCGPGQLQEPAGVGVNETTGDVYVVARGDDRVEYFAFGGVFRGELNGSGLLSGEGNEAGSRGEAGEIETGRFQSSDEIVVAKSWVFQDPIGMEREEEDVSSVAV